MGKPTPSRFVNKIRHLIENFKNGDIKEVYNAFKQQKNITKIYSDKMWNRTKEGFEYDLRRSPKKFEVYSKLFNVGKYIRDTDIDKLVEEHATNLPKWKELIGSYDAENERLKKEDKSFSSLGKYFRKRKLRF